jgi:hypothetical protein
MYGLGPDGSVDAEGSAADGGGVVVLLVVGAGGAGKPPAICWLVLTLYDV